MSRWEWRTFGPGFEAGERRLASLEPDRVEESDETYVLAPGSDASVKVRDGRIDVKHLLRADEDGLEQWTPVLKAPFPLTPEQTQLVLDSLAVDGPRPDDGAQTLNDLVGAGAIAFDVHKHRAHFTIGGCMAELTEIRSGSGAARTIAIEAEDPARVRAVVRELGLGDREVACMARGLKALAR